MIKIIERRQVSEMKEAKRYDKVFKATIVELHKKGKSIAELSCEYGISKQSIGSWIKLTKKVGKIEGEEISYKELLELWKKVKYLALKSLLKLPLKKLKGSIIHTNRGSQHTARNYRKKLSEEGMIESYSRRGNPYDNACIESFHSVLKKELITLMVR